MQQLIDLIKTNSLKRGEFTLASGVKSDYLIDLKTTMLHPLGAVLIADAILNAADPFRYEIDAWGGMAVGAVPIIAVVCAQSYRMPGYFGKMTPGFFVRKTTKGHGTNLLIDGCLKPGMTAVLIEDVTTTGGSVLQAVQAVREFGAQVSRVITVVDRLEGAEDNLRQHNIALTALLTRDDLLT
jgi:orotate phosphoribosyltransferase